jgi:hypothetical protein
MGERRLNDATPLAVKSLPIILIARRRLLIVFGVRANNQRMNPASPELASFRT